MADKKISQLTSATTPLAGTEVLPIVQSSSTVKVSVANLTAGRTVNGLSFSLDAASAGLPTTFGGIAHFNANDYTYVVAKATGNGLILNNGTGSAAVRLLNPSGNGYIEFNTGAGGAVTSALSAAGSFVPPAAQGIDFSANTGAAGETSSLLNWYEEGTFTPTIIGTSSAGAGTYSAQVGTYTRIGNRVLFQVYMGWSAHTGTGDMRIAGLPFTSSSTSNTLHCLSVWSNDLALTASNVAQAYVIQGNTTIALQQVPVGGGGASNIAMDTAAAIMVAGHYLV